MSLHLPPEGVDGPALVYSLAQFLVGNGICQLAAEFIVRPAPSLGLNAPLCQ